MNGDVAEGMGEFRVAYTEIHQPLVVGGMSLVSGLSGGRNEAEELFAGAEPAGAEPLDALVRRV